MWRSALRTDNFFMSRKTLTFTLLLAVMTAGTTLGQAHATDKGPEIRVTVAKKVNGRLAIETRTSHSPRETNRVIVHERRERGFVAASVERRVYATAVDPKLPEQYGLNLLQAARTWSYPDARGTIVAVVDSGVDGTHPDLAGRVLQGAEFVSGSDGPSTGNGWRSPHFHGTAVAGVIGATVDNGVGMAGLARGVRILPVRTLGADGSGYTSDTARGIAWAVDQGARVINLSLGATTPSAVEKAAIDYALSKNVVVVASAGNSGDSGNPVTYPAAYPRVIAVGAYDARRVLAGFSQRGSFVDLTAPGVGITATLPGGRYGAASGTSFSAPFVSATAALIRGNSPSMTATGVQSLLTGTATDLGAPGRDDLYGAGSVDPAKALATVAVPQAAHVSVGGPSSAMVGTRMTIPVSVRWRAAGTPITMQRYTAGAWRTVTTAGAGWTGQVAVSAAVPAGTSASYRVVGAGVVSPTKVLRITPVPRRTVAASVPTRVARASAPVSIRIGGGRTVSSVPVAVHYRAPRSTAWRGLGTWKTGTTGRLTVNVGLASRGTWQFRATAERVSSAAVTVRY